MPLTIDEYFEYRHKKFDRRKRALVDSAKSSKDYDLKQVGIESLDDSSPTQQSLESSSTFSHAEQHCVAAPSPPCKRRRTSPFSIDASYTTAYSPVPFHSLRSTPAPKTVSINAPTVILPKISHESLYNICKYHGNNVSKFSKKETSPKDEERCDKNTIVSHINCKLKELDHVSSKEQHQQFSLKALDILERAIKCAADLYDLMKLSDMMNSKAAISAEKMNNRAKLLELTQGLQHSDKIRNLSA